ncbi:MAG: HlyC/CorC family transporter [Erysipelotrichaceae bacterium]|nr:HlyC/CorC family transporter [Erysipelotrichaceae bacterium]MBQ7890405.1 HlyC/CorC family transporter [Erysipelotrichaceae bacterium]
MNPYLAIVLLLIGSAFFSSSEIAYASANKSRLKKAAESGDKKGKWAQEISEHYDKTLTAVLIGNNLVNIASSSVATVIAMALVGDAGVAVATAVMTILLLIFGEIVPKQLAKQFCDSYALAVSPIMKVVLLITRPFVWLFGKIIHVISKSWAWAKTDTSITYEDLVTIIETVEEEGVIDEDCSELLQSAIEFDETEVQEISTHRVEMTALDINDSTKEIIETALNSEYSRIPVFEDTIDNIIGILPVNLLLKELLDTDQPDIKEMLQEPLFVPQTKKLPEVLDLMQRSKIHMAIVTDDHGGTLGIVTMEDILEELVGEIWDETDTIEEEILQVSENEFLADGSMMLNDFLEYFEIEDPELDDYIITVNGWITEILDDYPKVNDSFDYKNYHIIIEETDDLVVSSLKVIRTETKDNDDEEAL